MRKKLQRVFFIGSLLTTLMAALAIAMMVKVKLDDTRMNLRSILSATSAWAVESPARFQTLAEEIAASAEPMRVTFLLENGMVLADSEAEAATVANQLNRPEIQGALSGDVGESLRISDTQDTLVMYAAVQLSPILILRLSYPLTDMVRMVIIYSAALLAMFLSLYVLQRRMTARYARDLVGQVEGVRRLLEGQLESVDAVFPEFQPALNQIAYLVRRLHSDMQEITKTMNLRSDFVANASHELRSPLTSIMGFAEMLDEGLADTPEEQALCIRTIRGECERMLEVISDILQLSRAEGQTDVTLERVNVTQLAGEIVQSLAVQAKQKKISLHVSGEAEVMALSKDVWEILYNLTDNAIRYGREGGRVEILLSKGEIRVKDNGVGVAPEHLPHLFEQFYRVDETRGMASGGTGLGLSIVRTLVARCGGTIDVESMLGAGSTFTVCLAPSDGGQEETTTADEGEE